MLQFGRFYSSLMAKRGDRCVSSRPLGIGGYKQILLAFLLPFFLVGCGVSRHVSPPEAPTVSSSSVALFLHNKPTAQPFRVNATALISGPDDLSLRSSIYISIVPNEGIVIAARPLPFVEIGRLYFLRDSVVAIDKLQKQYVCADYKVLSKLLNLDLSYSLVESLLLGHLAPDAVDLKILGDQQLSARPLGRGYSILYSLFRLPARPAKSTLSLPAHPRHTLEIDYKGYYDKMQGATPKALTARFLRAQYSAYQLDVSLGVPSFDEDVRGHIVPSVGRDYRRVELAWLLDKLLQL